MLELLQSVKLYVIAGCTHAVSQQSKHTNTKAGLAAHAGAPNLKVVMLTHPILLFAIEFDAFPCAAS